MISDECLYIIYIYVYIGIGHLLYNHAFCSGPGDSVAAESHDGHWHNGASWDYSQGFESWEYDQWEDSHEFWDEEETGVPDHDRLDGSP